MTSGWRCRCWCRSGYLQLQCSTRSPPLRPRFLTPLYTLYILNPMAGVVDTFRRAVVLHQSPDLPALAMSALVVSRYRAGSLRLLQVRRADDGGRRMSDATVDVAIENVSKQYRLSTSRNARTFWALQDVSLNVLRGASVGVIGRNGAGKSTLLKLLAGITAPTRGRIVIHGRVAALIEVGSGFHPELTGRENVFLSGAILGMRRA